MCVSPIIYIDNISLRPPQPTPPFTTTKHPPTPLSASKCPHKFGKSKCTGILGRMLGECGPQVQKMFPERGQRSLLVMELNAISKHPTNMISHSKHIFTLSWLPLVTHRKLKVKKKISKYKGVNERIEWGRKCNLFGTCYGAYT